MNQVDMDHNEMPGGLRDELRAVGATRSEGKELSALAEQIGSLTRPELDGRSGRWPPGLVFVGMAAALLLALKSPASKRGKRRVFEITLTLRGDMH